MQPTQMPEGIETGDIAITVRPDADLFDGDLEIVQRDGGSVHISDPDTAREIADELVRFADWREGKPEVTTTTQTSLRYPGFSVTITVPHDADYDAKAALDASWALVRLLTARTEPKPLPNLDAELGLEGLSSQPEDRG